MFLKIFFWFFAMFSDRFSYFFMSLLFFMFFYIFLYFSIFFCASRSHYFEAMFRPGGMIESSKQEVRMERHDKDTFSRMLEFLYTGAYIFFCTILLLLFLRFISLLHVYLSAFWPFWWDFYFLLHFWNEIMHKVEQISITKIFIFNIFGIKIFTIGINIFILVLRSD